MMFETDNLVEAALMKMRLRRDPKCNWMVGRPCVFAYDDAQEEDVEFARSNPLVKAREFNHSLQQVKTAMYSSRDD